MLLKLENIGKIKNQLKKDKENMQLSIDYPEDPFTGSEE